MPPRESTLARGRKGEKNGLRDRKRKKRRRNGLSGSRAQKERKSAFLSHKGRKGEPGLVRPVSLVVQGKKRSESLFTSGGGGMKRGGGEEAGTQKRRGVPSLCSLHGKGKGEKKKKRSGGAASIPLMGMELGPCHGVGRNRQKNGRYPLPSE